jgi:hypothetical protein
MEACEKILSFFEKAGYKGIAIGHEIFVENGEKRIKARFFPSLRLLVESLEHAIYEYNILIVPAGENIHEYPDI